MKLYALVRETNINGTSVKSVLCVSTNKKLVQEQHDDHIPDCGCDDACDCTFDDDYNDEFWMDEIEITEGKLIDLPSGIV